VSSRFSTNSAEIGYLSNVKNYDRFAPIYDIYFRAFSRRVFPVIERLCLAGLAGGADVLDVCCGAGGLAALLVQRGFNVTGIDGSADMLRIARLNAPGAQFLLADVREFCLPLRFDVAISTFDSINHILDERGLEATFRNVFTTLRPDSRFVFDMNMDEGYLLRWQGIMHGIHDGREFEIQAVYSPETRLARNIVKWSEGAIEEPSEMVFTERGYTEEEVRSALSRAGFSEIKVYDGHRHLGMAGEIGRAFFVCEKDVGKTSEPTVRFAFEQFSPETLTKPQIKSIEGTFPLREITTCVEDSVWPQGESTDAEALLTSQRLRAIAEVLRRLPPEPYERLKRAALEFDWFYPGDTMLGSVPIFKATYVISEQEKEPRRFARIIYLSPVLECQEWAVVVTVVVHELGHVILAHRSQELDREAFQLQEEEVHFAIREWGFGSDADRAEAFLRNQSPRRSNSDPARGIRPLRASESGGRFA
jgi:SAM-dependent methyltransferase